MNSTVKHLSLFFSIVAVLTALPFLGLQYYEGHTDPGLIAFYNCLITSTPEANPNDGNWKFITHGLVQLYSSFPQIDWYGIAVLLLFSLAAFILWRIIVEVLRRTNAFHNSILLKIALFGCGLLFVENLVLLEFTRMSFLLSFLGLSHVLIEGTKKRISILGIVAILLAGMVRIQPALLSIVVSMPLLVFLIITKRVTLTTGVKAMSVPVLFLLFLVSTATEIKSEADKQIMENAGYLLNIWDFDPTVSSFDLSNQKDSMTFEMTRIHFMNDVKHINPDFFNRIGVPYTRKQVNSIPALLSNTIDLRKKFYQNGVKYLKKHTGWSLLFLGIWLLMFFSLQKDKTTLLFVIFIPVYFTLLYFGIAVFLKMADRIFSPLYFGFCLSMILFIAQGVSSGVKAKMPSILVSMFLIGSILAEASSSIGLFKTRSIEVKERNQILDLAYNSGFKNQFVGFVSGWFYYKPFQKDAKAKETTYLSIDNQGFCYMKTYQEHMQMNTKQQEVSGYWRFASNPENRCVFISEKDRLNLILDYFNLQYGMNMRAEPVMSKSTENLPFESNIGFFTITN